MKERVGYIKKVDMDKCEEGHVFSYSTNDANTVQMGIQKREIKSLFVPTYVNSMEDRKYTLKDKSIHNLLYLCVEGDIDG